MIQSSEKIKMKKIIFLAAIFFAFLGGASAAPVKTLPDENPPPANAESTKNDGERADVDLTLNTDEKANLGTGGIGIVVPGTPQSFGELAKMVMRFLGITIVLASVLGFMIGGSFLIFSAGSENTAERGKSILLASIIGLSVTLLAYLIVTLFQSIFYSF